MLIDYLDRYIPHSDTPLDGANANFILRMVSLGINDLTYNALQQKDYSLLRTIYNDQFHNQLESFFRGRGFVDEAPGNDENAKACTVDFVLSSIDAMKTTDLSGCSMSSPDGLDNVPIDDEAANLFRKTFRHTRLLVPFYNLHSLDKKTINNKNLHPIYLTSPQPDFTEAEYAAVMLLGLKRGATDDYGFLSISQLPDNVRFNPFVSKLSFHSLKVKNNLDLDLSANYLFDYNKVRTDFFRGRPLLQAIETLCPADIEPLFTGDAYRLQVKADSKRKAAYYQQAAHIFVDDLNAQSSLRNNKIASLQADAEHPALALYNKVLREYNELWQDKTQIKITLPAESIAGVELSLPENICADIKKSVSLFKEKILAKAALYVSTYEKLEQIAGHSLSLPPQEQLNNFNDILTVIDFFSDFSEANALNDYNSMNTLMLNALNYNEALNSYSIVKRYVNSISNIGAANLINQSSFGDYFTSQVLYLRFSQIPNMGLENTYLNTYSIAKLLAVAEIKYPGIVNNEELKERLGFDTLSDFFKTKSSVINSREALNLFHTEFNMEKKVMLDNINASATSAPADMSFLNGPAL